MKEHGICCTHLKRPPTVFAPCVNQAFVEHHTPPTDALLLSVPIPTISPDSIAEGRVSFEDMQQVGHGGFGEVYKGIAMEKKFDNTITKIPFALKRALPPNTPGADIEQHLRQQTRRLDSLQREARVYFSPTFNTGQCLHLALLYDVAQARNSDGDDEPLLVLQWADGPGNTLQGWLKQHSHTDIAVTIWDRLSFAVQMFAGLRELHYGKVGAACVGASEVHPTASTAQPLFVHQDLKPDNILLFGGCGKGGGGPVRLALTDFGLTVQYNAHKRNAFGSAAGTAAYMAPEQWMGLPPLSPGRDMWAAGMVLAQLFSGAATARALAKYRHYVKKGQ